MATGSSYSDSSSVREITRGNREGKEIRIEPKQCAFCDDDNVLSHCKTCCKHLCKHCHQSHGRQRDTRNHDIFVLTPGSPFDERIKCEVHSGEAIQYLCVTCASLECAICIKDKHSLHDQKLMEHCMQQIKNICQDKARDLRVDFDSLSVKEEHVTEMNTELNESFNELEDKLDKRQCQVSALVMAIEKESIKKVKEQQRETTILFTETVQKLKLFNSNCKDVLGAVMPIVLGRDVDKIIQCIQNMNQYKREASEITQKVRKLEEFEMLRISDPQNWLTMMLDITRQYLRIERPSEKQLVNTLIEDWSKPLIQAARDEALTTAAIQYKHELDELREENISLRERLEDEEISKTLAQRQLSSKKTSRLNREFVVVVVLAMGKEYSSVGYSFRADELNVKTEKFGAFVGLENVQAPTAVLLNDKGRFIAFGYEAEKNYVDEEGDKYEIYETFMVDFCNSKSDTLSRKGHRTATTQMVQLYMCAFIDYIVHILESECGLDKHAFPGLRPSPYATIRWVITVPNVCDEGTFKKVQEALQVCNTRSVVANASMIIRESDALSLYCRKVDTDQFLHQSGHVAVKCNVGDRYMIISCTGSFIEASCFKTTSESPSDDQEIYTNSNNKPKAKDAFSKLLEDVLGTEYMTKFRSQCASDWSQLMIEFAKRRKSYHNTDQSMRICLPYNISALYSQEYDQDFVKAINNSGYPGVKFSTRGGALYMENSVAHKILHTEIDPCVNFVNKLLKKPHLIDVKHIFVVSDFKYINETFISSFDKVDGREVYVLQDTDTAIVKGSVMRGHRSADIVHVYVPYS